MEIGNHIKSQITSQLRVRAFEEKETGIFTIKAAKVGSASYNWLGDKLIFSEESLANYAHTWKGGIITLNHMYVDDNNSMILSSEFNPSDKLVYMDIKVANEKTAERIRAKEPTGVSIEANVVGDTPDNEIIAFTGTGVSIVFYPDQPACSIEEGCGIVSKTLNTDDSLSNQKRASASANTATPLRVETTLSGGITIDEINEPDTPGTTLATNTDGAVSQEDFQKISAKLIATRKELAEIKAGAKDKEYMDQIQAKDAKITELQAELDERDSAVASEMIEKIQVMDPKFSAEGQSLSALETIYASLSRMEDKIRSTKEESTEDSEGVESGEFRDPKHSSEKKEGLSIGGISGGVWTGGNGKVPVSAKVPRGDQ